MVGETQQRTTVQAIFVLLIGLFGVVGQLLGLAGIYDQFVEWTGVIEVAVERYTLIRDRVFAILPFHVPAFVKNYLVVGFANASIAASTNQFWRAFHFERKDPETGDDGGLAILVAWYGLVFLAFMIFWPFFMILGTAAVILKAKGQWEQTLSEGAEKGSQHFNLQLLTYRGTRRFFYLFIILTAAAFVFTR
jgi:hypothetical protein